MREREIERERERERDIKRGRECVCFSQIFEPKALFLSSCKDRKRISVVVIALSKRRFNEPEQEAHQPQTNRHKGTAATKNRMQKEITSR